MREQERLRELKERMLSARRVEENGDGVEGMIIDKPEELEEADEDAEAEGTVVARRIPGRKTKQQRKKAERLRAEVRTNLGS